MIEQTSEAQALVKLLKGYDPEVAYIVGTSIGEMAQKQQIAPDTIPGRTRYGKGELPITIAAFLEERIPSGLLGEDGRKQLAEAITPLVLAEEEKLRAAIRRQEMIKKFGPESVERV